MDNSFESKLEVCKARGNDNFSLVLNEKIITSSCFYG